MEKHLLVTLGEEKFEKRKQSKEMVHFMNNEAEDTFLNDLENTPHAFVLACLMDKQIKAEKAWHIPYVIREELGCFDIETLGNVGLDRYISIFEKNRLHRFNRDQAEIFYLGVHRILDIYEGDISKIWCDNPSSAKVVYEFLQFKGAGVKIATMTANILVRDFLIPFSDYYSIDISPDTHIMKIMKRTGLVSKDADRDSVIYKARELNPSFPGIIDFSCWEIGRSWCHLANPDCENCILREVCEKCI